MESTERSCYADNGICNNVLPADLILQGVKVLVQNLSYYKTPDEEAVP